MANIDPEILKRIDALAAKLGVTADHILTILHRQARVVMVEDFLVIGAVIIIVPFTIWWCSSVVRREKGPMVDEPSVIEVVTMIVACSATGILTIFAVSAIFSDLPTLIMNPDYWVLTQIGTFIK